MREMKLIALPNKNKICLNKQTKKILVSNVVIQQSYFFYHAVLHVIFQTCVTSGVMS